MQSSSGSTSTNTTRHVPVLLQHVLEVLDIQQNDVVLDGTLGGGGHAHAFATALSADGHLVGFDLDSDAIARAQQSLSTEDTPHTLMQGNFKDARTLLTQHGIDGVDKAFFDLGWSSDQLEVSGRGFSFERDEPLTMTLSNAVDEHTLTAHDIVNTWQEESLADIIYGWGQERYARRIARGIVRARESAPIETTTQLADIVKGAVPAPYRTGKRHPATKTFQALRIAVNDELGALEQLLVALPDIIQQNGRVAVLTFHSLEDRLVKEYFRAWAQNALGEVITKKPIAPDDSEIGYNRRARSAKLRGFKFTHYENSNTTDPGEE